MSRPAVYLWALGLMVISSQTARGSVLISGHVFLKKGGSLPAALISLYRPGEDDPVIITQSLQNGSFILRAPRPGPYRLIVTRAPAYPLERTLNIPDTGLPNLDLLLSSPHLIRLELNGLGGTPITGGLLQAWVHLSLPKVGSLDPSFFLPLSEPPILVFTDAPWVSLDTVTAIDIDIRLPGVGWAAAHLNNWPDNVIGLGLQPGTILDGTVLNSTGRPVTETTVALEALSPVHKSHLRVQTLTGQGGRFMIDSLPPGEYRVEIPVPGAGTHSQVITVAGARTEITFSLHG